MFPAKSTILLIGCPTLLIPLLDDGHSVKLLDIDSRFEKHFPPKEFSRFNLVNCHIFTESDRVHVAKFCARDNLKIICDPPFGVMVDVFMRSFKTLSPKAEIFVFMPWFSDTRFEKHQMKMIDYR